MKCRGKIDNVLREMKMLFPNFENILSEFMYVLDVMYGKESGRKVEQNEQKR